MEGDAAQLAALIGALGAALVLLAAGRVPLIAGFALLAGAEVALVLDLSGHTSRVSPALAALGVVSLVPMAVAAFVLVRYPFLVTPVVVAVAPFRPPLSFGSEHRFYVAAADPGELGRLLPLYVVLGAAALALAWRALRGPRSAGPVARLDSRGGVPRARRSLAVLDEGPACRRERRSPTSSSRSPRSWLSSPARRSPTG